MTWVDALLNAISRDQYIIDLMTDKESIVQTNVIEAPCVVNYQFLSPGKYKLKVIYDRNRNNRWDPGYYKKQLLPERVNYCPLVFDIRANWELQEEWVIP
jgi:hypothetical protein